MKVTEVSVDNYEKVWKKLETELKGGGGEKERKWVSVVVRVSGGGEGEELQEVDYDTWRREWKEYRIFQVGLTLFQQASENSDHTTTTYNFYLFPGAIPRFRNEEPVRAQYSRMRELAREGFDFNRLLSYGISYLSKKTEVELREKREEDLNSPRELTHIDERGQAFLDEARKDIEEWYNAPKDMGYKVVATTSRYCKRLLYQEIELNYPKKIIASGSRYGVRLDKYTKAANKKETEFKKKRLEREMNELIGFRKIIDLLVELQTPILCHHPIFTMGHLLNHFVLEDPPESLPEFFTTLQQYFPRLYDPQYLSQQLSLPVTQPAIPPSSTHLPGSAGFHSLELTTTFQSLLPQLAPSHPTDPTFQVKYAHQFRHSPKVASP